MQHTCHIHAITLLHLGRATECRLASQTHRLQMSENIEFCFGLRVCQSIARCVSVSYRSLQQEVLLCLYLLLLAELTQPVLSGVARFLCIHQSQQPDCGHSIQSICFSQFVVAHSACLTCHYRYFSPSSPVGRSRLVGRSVDLFCTVESLPSFAVATAQCICIIMCYA